MIGNDDATPIRQVVETVYLRSDARQHEYRARNCRNESVATLKSRNEYGYQDSRRQARAENQPGVDAKQKVQTARRNATLVAAHARNLSILADIFIALGGVTEITLC